jgi:hypothetical protein
MPRAAPSRARARAAVVRQRGKFSSGPHNGLERSRLYYARVLSPGQPAVLGAKGATLRCHCGVVPPDASRLGESGR